MPSVGLHLKLNFVISISGFIERVLAQTGAQTPLTMNLLDCAPLASLAEIRRHTFRIKFDNSSAGIAVAVASANSERAESHTHSREGRSVMADWLVKTVIGKTGAAEFVVGLPGARQGQPLQADQDDLVTRNNETNDQHQLWETDSNYDPVSQSSLPYSHN